MSEPQTRRGTCEAGAGGRGPFRRGPRSECERAIDRTKGRVPWLAEHSCERSGCRAGGKKGARMWHGVPHIRGERPKRRIAVARSVAASDARREFRYGRGANVL